MKNLKGTRIFYRNFFAQKTIPNRFSLSLPHTGRVRESRTLFLSDAALSCLHLTVSYVMGPALLGGSSSKLSKHSFERRRRRRETPSRECVCARDSSWHIARTSCFFSPNARNFLYSTRTVWQDKRQASSLTGGERDERELPKSAVK